MAERALEPIETATDLVRILKYAEYRENGVEFSLLQSLGLHFPEAAAVELRRRGYGIEVRGTGGARRLRLKSTPAQGAARRKREQGQLFEPPSKRGNYEDAA